MQGQLCKDEVYFHRALPSQNLATGDHSDD